MSRSNPLKRFVLVFLLLVCLVGALVLAWLAFSLYRPLSEAKTTYEKIEKEYARTLQSGTDWERFQSVYPNAVGWLSSPDLGFSYPVMQAEDNTFYLTHLPNGTQNPVGSVYMDASNSPQLTDALTVIYGHHVGNGEMFSPLVQYRQQSFLQEHPTMYYTTSEKQWKIELFAAHEGSEQADYLWEYSTLTQEQRSEWLNRLEMRADSYIPLAKEEDQLMVLVTCASLRSQAPRCIIYGVIKEMSQ